MIGIESDIKNLDIRFSADANALAVSSLMAQSLIRVGQNFEPELDLAKSYRMLDSRTYEFEIPDSVYFQDAHPLTVQDVEFSFRDALRPGSGMAKRFSDIESFQVHDRFFRIRLRAPRASFLLEDVTEIRILPRHLAHLPAYSQSPIGSGPYRFVRRSYRDLIFERFDQYQVAGESRIPAYPRVIVRVLADSTTRFLSLLGSDVDFLFNSLSPRLVKEAQKREDLRVYRAPGQSVQYLGFNLRSKKFQNKKFRQALSYAIDRNALIRFKLKGFATPAISFLPPHHHFFSAHLQPYSFDFNKARRLLKESGQEGVEIELKSSSDRDVLSVLTALKEQWEKLGVRVRLRPFEFATFFSDVRKGNFEVFYLRWTSLSDPDFLYRFFHSSQQPPGLNRTGFEDSRVDDLLEKARSELNFSKRKKYYEQAQEILHDELPMIPLWHPDNVVVASATVREFQIHPLGSWRNALYTRKDPKGELSP